MKNNFSIRNIFGLTSALKGHDKIRFLTAYINFGLSFTDLSKPYKSLMALISSVVTDIQSPVLTHKVPTKMDNERGYSPNFRQLFRRTVEMLAFFEGYFPDSEQQFTHHELVDIVYALRHLGPVRSWWTYAGERLMKVIKDKCPTGGQNPMETLAKYYFADENGRKFLQCTKKRSKQLDNLGRYRDNRIVLQGLPEVLKKRTGRNGYGHT